MNYQYEFYLCFSLKNNLIFPPHLIYKDFSHKELKSLIFIFLNKKSIDLQLISLSLHLKGKRTLFMHRLLSEIFSMFSCIFLSFLEFINLLSFFGQFFLSSFPSMHLYTYYINILNLLNLFFVKRWKVSCVTS